MPPVTFKSMPIQNLRLQIFYFLQVKSRLQHERNMKLGAFNRVDELQTQVYDYEYAVSNISRPFTSMSKLCLSLLF